VVNAGKKVNDSAHTAPSGIIYRRGFAMLGRGSGVMKIKSLLRFLVLLAFFLTFSCLLFWSGLRVAVLKYETWEQALWAADVFRALAEGGRNWIALGKGFQLEALAEELFAPPRIRTLLLGNLQRLFGFLEGGREELSFLFPPSPEELRQRIEQSRAPSPRAQGQDSRPVWEIREVAPRPALAKALQILRAGQHFITPFLIFLLVLWGWAFYRLSPPPVVKKRRALARLLGGGALWALLLAGGGWMTTWFWQNMPAVVIRIGKVDVELPLFAGLEVFLKAAVKTWWFWAAVLFLLHLVARVWVKEAKVKT
jgi:hypothetical protein